MLLWWRVTLTDIPVYLDAEWHVQVTKQAMNYAIRTGITITSGYAIQQCGRLLKVRILPSVTIVRL